jgi:hypothetical protein
MRPRQARKRTPWQKPLVESVGTLATRADLSEARNILQTEVAGIKPEFRTEVAGIKPEFRTEIAGIKGDIKLLRWMAGFNLALTVAVLRLLIRGET